MREPESRYTQTEGSLDELAKGLASGTLSRRGALRIMGAALLGGALASMPGVAWAAKPGGCASGVRCKGKCCAVGATCATKGGGCTCPAGQTECGGVCRDLTTDMANCGVCGNACAQGASCVGGQCVCQSGQDLCPGTNVCVQGCSATSGEVFDPTTCRCECPTGETLCPGNNTCVQNCPSGQTLNTATCTCECPPGTTTCGTTCCPSGQGCSNGTCLDMCPAPLTCCCHCQYTDSVTGALISTTCNVSTTTTTREQCEAQCYATMPPGSTLHRNHIGHSCVSAESGWQLVCTKTTNSICNITQCAPTGT